jgi:hypothetical protein
MSFAARSKDDPGDVVRSADQQQSVDNENHIFAGLYGPTTNPPGMVRAWVQNTGLADNVLSTIFRVFTTNEAGANDGGVYGLEFLGIIAHGKGPTLDTSTIMARVRFSRAMAGAGTGLNNAVITSFDAVAASTAATKSIGACSATITEVSEYEISVGLTIDLTGTTVTTSDVYGLVQLYYAGFTTPPTVVSEG